MAKVSIGVPVYNGERYLAGALEALLAQTFTDLEIIICDNASTDGTAQICQSYAARDPRIRVHRNPENIGAAPNFNLVARMATGPYFKWAAHDDLLAPTFIERCVEVLDRDPEVVLAFTHVTRIDENGNIERERRSELPLDSRDVVTRFQALIDTYDCLEVFGLIRRDALMRTALIESYAHGDGVLLARLALLGRFEEVQEPLFLSRHHATQSGEAYRGDYRRFAVWFDPALTGRRLFPNWRIQAELWRTALAPDTRLGARDRARCLMALARWARLTRHVLFEDAAFHAKDIVRSLIGARK